MTAFKRTKNLKEIIGGICIENGKVKRLSISVKAGKCTSCFSGARNLCRNQVLTTTTFLSKQGKRTFNTFSSLTVKKSILFT